MNCEVRKMGLFDNSVKVNLTITSGKAYLKMGILSTSIAMKKVASGNVTFGNAPEEYAILDYNWDGPRYKEVVSSVTNQKTKHKGKEKEQRKGRVTGAVIGTLLFPGVGTVIGASLGTGKKTVGKEKEKSTGKENVTSENVETASNATMRLQNIETGETFTIGFSCTSAIDAELQNFYTPPEQEPTVSDQSNIVDLLKGYKELLDAGIITEEEFIEKKNELL